MIRRLPAALTAAVLLGAATPALAADVLSNSYWDAAYLNSKVEVDTASVETEGFRLGASLGLAKFLNFTGDYDQRRERNDRLGFGSAGFAYHTQDPVWQVHGALTYERVENDNGSNPAGDYVEDGYGVEVGGRYAFTDVELSAVYRYLDFGSFDGTDGAVDFTGSRIAIGAALQLGNWWSLVADYRIREHKFETNVDSGTVDFSEWTVGFRRYFVTDTDRKNRHGGVLNRGGDEEEAVE
jgi:hypothetical protein